MVFKSNANMISPVGDLKDGKIFLYAGSEVLSIKISKQVGFGDGFVLDSSTLGIDTVDLHTKDLQEAVRKSKEVINAAVLKLQRDVQEYIDDDSAVKLVSY